MAKDVGQKVAGTAKDVADKVGETAKDVRERGESAVQRTIRSAGNARDQLLEDDDDDDEVGRHGPDFSGSVNDPVGGTTPESRSGESTRSTSAWVMSPDETTRSAIDAFVVSAVCASVAAAA